MAEGPAVPFARCLSLCGVPLSVSGLEPNGKSRRLSRASLLLKSKEALSKGPGGKGSAGFRSRSGRETELGNYSRKEP